VLVPEVRVTSRFALVFVVLLLASSCTVKSSVFGLKPEYPENRIGGLYRSDTNKIVFVEVDSLQPTLRWESFPRPQDLKEDKALSAIKNVTYDLKIWRSEGGYPAAIICSKQGLNEPHYRLEEPLEPCSRYFWTIRARFELGEKVRVTEWGISTNGIPQDWEAILNSSLALGRRSPIVPNRDLYRFKAPCSETTVSKGPKTFNGK
jgi:hypothetical protein